MRPQRHNSSRSREQRLILLLIAFNCLLAVSLSAQTWNSIVWPNNGTPSVTPTIRVEGLTIHLVYKYTDLITSTSRIAYKQSDHPGNTWPVAGTQVSDGTRDANAPDMVVVGNNVHVVWFENQSGNTDIHYSRSTDNGAVFSAQRRLNTVAGEGTNSAIYAVNSTIHVVWEDWRHGNLQIYYRRSTDNGLTWDTETRLTNNSNAPSDPAISAIGQNVFVVWMESRAGQNCIYFRRSVTNGQTWESEVQVFGSSAIFPAVPKITAVQDKIHLVYQGIGSSPNSNSINYIRNDLMGQPPWSSPQAVVSSDSSLDSPAISASNTNVYLIWEDARGQGRDMRRINYLMSTNHGDSWSGDQQISETFNTPAESPSISSANGSIYTTWYERHYNEVVFRQGNLPAISYRYNFTGHVYEGTMPDKSKSLAGVTLEIWGDDNDNPEDSPGTRIVSDATNSFGDFYLHTESATQLYNYYHLVEIDPADYTSTGAEASDPAGVVTHDNCITYTGSAMTVGNTYDNNFFWDAPAGLSPYTFQGHVYEGAMPDMSVALPGVDIELWGDDNADPEDSPGVHIATETSNSSGEFSIHSGSATESYNFYHLFEIDPPGYISTGAEAGDPAGVVTNEGCITYTGSALTAGNTYANNNFWDEHTGLSPCTFTGHVYEGHKPETGMPLSGVDVDLLGDDNDDPHDGHVMPPIDICTTNSSGEFSLTADELHNFYHVVERDPADYVSTGVEAPLPGTTSDTDPNTVTYSKLDLTPGEAYTDIDFWDIPTTSVSLKTMIPDHFNLHQNHPNPFNPSTQVTFSLPERSRITLEIYTVQGKRIRTLAAGMEEAGVHTRTWDGTDDRGRIVQSGLYLCMMKAPAYQKTIRMLLLK